MEISQIFFCSVRFSLPIRIEREQISLVVVWNNWTGEQKKNFKLFQACHVTIDMVFVFELIDIFRNMK